VVTVKYEQSLLI